jgi:hypothetical protein
MNGAGLLFASGVRYKGGSRLPFVTVFPVARLDPASRFSYTADRNEASRSRERIEYFRLGTRALGDFHHFLH